MADAADDADALAALERLPERPVADERQRPLAAALERAREAEHVLALREAAEAEKRRAVTALAELAARSLRVARREALEVDAAVDHLGLAARVGQRVLELRAQPVGDSDHRGGPPDDVSGRSAHAGLRPDVRDVLAVGRDDEWRARREGGSESGRHEEVRVGDVRIEASRCASGIAIQPQMTCRAA